ncbi:MAG: tetratricopeptide repeat protein [Candidatus Obscuribacterales bacterium]|nr:tetratricopeptide repeat protein [Candidatus Obscuribacterales bacterium]
MSTAASFANPTPPNKLEAERADAQKRAEAFFNRKTKSKADKAILYLQKYRPDLAIGIYTGELIKTAKTDLNKKENRQKMARLLTLIGRSFKLDENDAVSCALYRMSGRFDPDDLVNKSFLLESLVPTGRFAEAKKVRDELSKTKSDDPTVLRAMANYALFTEDYDSCYAYLERASEKKDDPLRYITLRVMAQCRIRQGIEEQVASLFEESAKSAESPYEQELIFGSMALSAMKPQEADEHFQRASKMLPDDVAWRTGRAQALGVIPNKHDESFQMAIDAVQKKRLTNRSMTQLANALQGNGQPQEANKCLERLKALKPWSWHPYLAKARLARCRGDNAGARKELFVAEKLNPSSGGAAIEIVTSYHCDGNLKEAMAACKRKLGDCPKNFQLWIKRGLIAREMKDYVDSKASYQKALSLIPAENSLNVIWKSEAAAAHAGLGTLAYIAGDKVTAAKEAREFNKLKFIPDLPAWLTIMVLRPNRIKFESNSKKEVEANDHTAMADMLLETRNLTDAVAEYAKAIELNPSDVDLHSYYLNALVENNNWVEAAKEDVVLSSKLVSRAADSVAKWAKGKGMKDKKDSKAAPQGQKNGQGS